MGKTRKGIALLLLVGMIMPLMACGHKHVWAEATCTEPKRCVECGVTEGEPNGHSWREATYEEPKTCTACGATEGTPKAIEVTGLFIDKSAVSLDIGETVDLQYTLIPENASDKEITWRSIDQAIATVDEHGSVVGVSEGKTTVICAAKNGVFSQCDVEVKAPSARSLLNEWEGKVFDFMTQKMLTYFYNAPAVRIRDIYGTEESLSTGFSLYLQGTNKIGGTIFKLYLVGTYVDPWNYADMTSMMNYNGQSMDTNVMDYKKINAALEEYWAEQGMK